MMAAVGTASLLRYLQPCASHHAIFLFASAPISYKGLLLQGKWCEGVSVLELLDQDRPRRLGPWRSLHLNHHPAAIPSSRLTNSP
jgi:hypothetical protein